MRDVKEVRAVVLELVEREAAAFGLEVLEHGSARFLFRAHGGAVAAGNDGTMPELGELVGVVSVSMSGPAVGAVSAVSVGGWLRVWSAAGSSELKLEAAFLPARDPFGFTLLLEELARRIGEAAQ
jgi:hypothetical protein